MTDVETHLEMRVRKLEETVTKLSDSLLGTLDGKPGAIALIRSSMEVSETNSDKLDNLSKQVDSLRIDRAKAAGIALVVSLFLGGIYKVFLK